MIIYVDIDNTIFKTKDADYINSSPIQDRIDKINSLFDSGNTIIYWTARGTGSGIDWSRLTKKQLKDSGARYHELKFGKPIYDLFIDDKNVNSEEYFND